MASLVAINYSEAIFELAQEEQKLDVVKEELVEINEVVKANPEFKAVLAHPQIEKADKKAMLLKVFADMDELTSNFVRLLIDRNRFMAFGDIVSEFIKKYNDVNNIDVAYVTSARMLDDQELTRIKAMLEKKTGSKIELRTNVDADLLAGIRVRIKDEILDNSIQTKLDKMKAAVVKTELN